MKKTLLLLTIAVLCLGTYASADTFTTTGNRAFFTTDFIDWGQLGPPGNFVNTAALVFSFLGTNAALVGDAGGGQFLTMQEGVTWLGNFDYGENLVWTGNAAFGVGGGGPFVIQLANPVGGIGFGISADLYAPFTATVSIYDKSLAFLTTLTFSGVNPFPPPENGSNLFIGIQDQTAVNIGAIVIDTFSGGYPWDHDFAIDAVSFNYTTPEPGTLILLGSGLIGAAGLIRRKLGR